MSTSENRTWGNGQVGILTLLLVIFFIWVFAGGRPFLRNTGRDIRTTVHDAGQDLKSAGRNAAASIRDTVN